MAGIRAEAPGLEIGVRVSAFDFVPFKPDPAQAEADELGPGVPDDYAACLPYRYGFGADEADADRARPVRNPRLPRRSRKAWASA